MVWFFLFIFGLAVGSFLNVVALRYDGDHFVLNPRVIGGRSRCPHCRKKLHWYELVPIVGFLLQRGRCRHCHVKIGYWYPAVELLSGLIFVLVPLRLGGAITGAASMLPLALYAAVWIAAFEAFLLVAYIDMRLGIIPDELNVALLLLAFAGIWVSLAYFGAANHSFFGSYAAALGLQDSVWTNHVIGALFGVLLFGGIVLATRGRGMGAGDAKFALPLGLLFGWPDILLIAMIAFIIGGGFGIGLIASGRKTMKSTVPFGPFLVIGATVAFFWGSALFRWYFHMVGL